MTEETKQETVSIAWCDSGEVDGKFAHGMMDVALKSGVKFETSIRSQGNQIGRQRETVLKYWYENNISDWLLWIDSDVVLSPESFKLLWDNKDAEKRPILTGVYFTTDTPEEPLMVPSPTIFKFAEHEGTIGIKRIHPMPKNELIQVDAAGMGFVLMHRSVVDKVLDKLPNATFFTEVGVHKTFMGEDIFFFALVSQCEIPVWCHTGAVVPHMKRFSFDVHYYNAFFGGVEETQKKKIITPKDAGKIILPK